MKAVIYARYSAGPKQTDQSIEGQVRVCREFAAARNIIIAEVYADQHISGTTDARPEFQRLISDAKHGKFEAVIVYKTDRFARDRYDSVVYKRELKKAGVQIFYAAEPIPEGPEGAILESLLEGMAEYYSKELAQKVRRGMTENALKGKSNGGTRVFGYRSDPARNIIIDETEAFYVREIFKRRIAGQSNREIADWLKVSGIKTTRGHDFSTEAINRLIRNRKYIGEYKYQDIMKKCPISSILDPETWQRAQRQVQKHKKVSMKYRLNGRIFCGLCKSPMHGVSGTGKSGKTWHYYTCAKRRMKMCELDPVSAPELEAVILKAAREYVLNDAVIGDLTAKISILLNDNTETDLLEKRLKEIKTKEDRCVKAVIEGAGTKPVIEELKALEESRLAIENELRRPRGPKLTENQISFALRHFARSDDNMVLEKFIARVEVFPDKVVVYFNIGDPDGGLKNIVIGFDENSGCSTTDTFVELRPSYGVLIIKVSF